MENIINENIDEVKIKVDYCEPDEKKEVELIPLERIIDKLSRILSGGDYDEAERLIHYWINEAVQNGDKGGEFSLCNELMGLYRKLGKQDEAIKTAEWSLQLLEQLEYEDAVCGATCYLNSATVYKAFGMPEKAIELFAKAKKVFEEKLDKTDVRLGGLYNNEGLALLDLRRYQDARDDFNKALEIMSKNEGCEAEMAISWLNLADVSSAQYGTVISKPLINEALNMAWKLLNLDSTKRSSDYAFICEKCAPIFGFYGQEDREDLLKKESEMVYQKNKEDNEYREL